MYFLQYKQKIKAVSFHFCRNKNIVHEMIYEYKWLCKNELRIYLFIHETDIYIRYLYFNACLLFAKKPKISDIMVESDVRTY